MKKMTKKQKELYQYQLEGIKDKTQQVMFFPEIKNWLP